MHQFCLRILSVFLGVFFLSQAAVAAERYVATDGDDNGGANDCSDVGSPCLTIARAIAASSSGDTINIAAGTYTENNLTVSNKTLIFQGAATDTTIVDGSAANSVFFLSSNSTYNVTFNDLTIQNGAAAAFGGGIRHDSGGMGATVNLTLNSVVVKNSTAATGGGGIYFARSGVLTLNEVTVTGNEAQVGAGILMVLDDDAVFTNTTIEGNDALNNDGNKQGGGILTNSTDVTMNNVTIANNLAGDNLGGGIYELDDAGNPNITVTNTIFDNNTGGNCEENLESAANSISSDDMCGMGGGQDSVDPLLDVLADNGGSILTMALLNSSPAINAGDNATCDAQDARGTARPQDVTCDIGAYEANCGDGMVQGTEECDDGNVDDADSCSNACLNVAPAEEEPEEEVPAVEEEESLCGNSAVDDGETCDDGNVTDGDGCSALCASEEETPASTSSASGGCALVPDKTR